MNKRKSNWFVSFKFLNGNRDKIRLIAFWVCLKSITRSGIIKGYNPGKLTKYTGLSRNTVEKYVGRLIDLGWAEKRFGCLKLTGKVEMGIWHCKRNNNIRHKYIRLQNTNINQTELQLIGFLFETKRKQSIYAAIHRTTKGRQSCKFQYKQQAQSTPLEISYEGIAKMICCGKSKAIGTVKKLVQSGIVQKKFREGERLGVFTHRAYEEYRKQYPNYILVPFPIRKKPNSCFVVRILCNTYVPTLWNL